jgi:hypothetical protein
MTTETKRSVLVRHPLFGSLWLDKAHIDGDRVVGEAWDDSGRGSALLPDDYRGQPETMNFPLGCIVKWEPPDA